MPTMANVPREMVHILARFVPLTVALLLRTDRAFWAHYVDDPFVWAEPVKHLQKSKEGRVVLRRYAKSIIARLPALSRISPEAMADEALHFDLSPDNRLIACGIGRTLQVLDADSHLQVASIDVDEVFYRLCFSPSGSQLACNGGQRIWLYDCSTWAKLLTLERAEMYWFSMAFLPDGTFVSGASNGNVLVWDGVKTEPTLVLPAEHGVWSLAATKTVFAAGVYASGRRTGLVALCAPDGEQIHELAGHRDRVRDLSFLVDGSRLVSASDDGTARVWNVLTGECVDVHDFKAGFAFSVSLSPSLGLLAVALYDANELRIVNLVDGKTVKTLSVDKPLRVRFAPTKITARQVVFFSERVDPNYPLLKIFV